MGPMLMLEWVLVLLLAAVVLTNLAERLAVPYPSLLAIAGAGLALLEALTMERRKRPVQPAHPTSCTGVRVKVETVAELAKVRKIIAKFTQVHAPGAV